ncbi:MAG TPA: DinB family protein [Anaerolineae bacterium]|nr:DinB family protein [Anaerolineae bacterium]
MDSNRKHWNEQQKEFHAALLGFKQHDRAMALFVQQHAALHSAKVTPGIPWSFEDEVLDDMTEAQIRRIPQGCDYSVAWHIWHLARIEDITMNLLLAGRLQCFVREGWQARLNAPVVDTGNAMTKDEVAALSEALDLAALREYRAAVGRETRANVTGLAPEAFKQKVDPARLRQVMEEGAVVEAARGIVDYWSRRTLAELLLMPPTRHNLVHLNESLRLKQKRR